MRQGLLSTLAIPGGLCAPTTGFAGEDRGWIGTFAQAVQRCWAPPEGFERVMVGFKMNRDGTVIDDSLRSIPREMERTKSFMAARRAILRCGRGGYDLPEEQYETWKEIELTFEPERLLGAVQ